MQKVIDFIRKHLIIINIVIMVFVTWLLLVLLNAFMDSHTNHGDEQVVPDFRNMTFATAQRLASSHNLGVELVDSVYDGSYSPGSVVEQNHAPGSHVKSGRVILLTVNAVTPPKVLVPSVVGTSIRQARANLKALGFNDITEVTVPSEYKDLVISVKCNGVNLRPNTRLTAGSPLVIEVGEGYVEPEETDDEEFDFTDADSYYD